ncbi:acyltransferase [Parvibaculaceae bacterium PLY_AMNH_Bact1]|nr:acyltransferase [Parvibaculaceae bacterium PLY_AMNH_Bact1]
MSWLGAGDKQSISEHQSFWLDAARGLSACLVMLGHIRAYFFGQYNEGIEGFPEVVQKAFFVFFGLGHEAVMVFFVMSGMLIAPKFLGKGRISTVYLARYILDRLARIYCVAIPMILISVIFAYAAQALYGHSYFHAGSDCAPSLWDVVANLLFLNNGFVETICSNGPYWSIHNEVYYYFAWPALLLVFLAESRRIKLAAVVFLVVSVSALLLFDAYDTHNTLLLMPVWVLGGLAVYIRRVPGSFPLWLSISMCVFVLPSLIPGNSTFLIEAYGLAIVFTCLFIAARNAPIPGRNITIFFRWLADISFSLYLSHAIFLSFIRTALEYGYGVSLPFNEIAWPQMCFFVIMGLLCLLLGHICYVLFESKTPKVRTLVHRYLLRALYQKIP